MSDTSDRTVSGPGSGIRATRRSSVVAVALLDAAPEWDRLTALLAPGTATADKFRHRIVEVPLGLEIPRRAVDVSWQLDRITVPTTGRVGDVLDHATTVHTAGDDHPHWGLTLIDGLTGGQAALVIRVVPPGRVTDDSPGIPGSVWEWLRSMPEYAARTVRDTTDYLAGTAAAMVRSVLTPGAPPIRIPSEAGTAPRLHVLDVPATTLREVTVAAGCAPESGIAAAVLLAHAEYRTHRGAPGGGSGGVGVDEPLLDDGTSPIELMRRVDALAVDAPGDPAPAARLFGPDDVLTCAVPGSPTPLHIAGAGIERYYGFGLTYGSAFNATLVPYHDTSCVGLSVDPIAVPDRAEFDSCLRSGVRAVLEA
ncbi:wax ester/triacylglycerol synthase domain-containing protein [Rhodococcus yananensis]|uniref:wax ester/triacylglycerol synthase domain-containing protein n=1 Tax=Rhodococcus yananensis TaxID=2879464 RepID=UPI003EBED1A7